MIVKKSASSLKKTKKNSLSYAKYHFEIIRQLIPYIWVKDWEIRIRYLVLAILTIFMIGLNVLIPIMLMKIISLFSEKDTASTHTSVILLLYGFLWTLSQFTALLREVFLFKAVERSVRLICHGVSAHIHRLSYNFYTTQKTGALLGYIEKTYKAFPCIFWGFTLSVIPTIIEVIIATSIIWYLYGYLLGLTLIGTLFIFIIFKFKKK